MSNKIDKAGVSASAVSVMPPMPPGFYLMDCMEAMKQFPDGFFDLAIVDPPYGGGASPQTEPVNGMLSGGGRRNGRTASGDASAGYSASTTSRRTTRRKRKLGQAVTLRRKLRPVRTVLHRPRPAAILRGGGTAWQRERGRWGQRFDRYHIGGADGRDMGQQIPPSTEGGANITHWDVAPPEEYFNELARVSKAQIIWGGNYFGLPPTRCFVVWDKQIPENFSMAMCEYAWTSFNANAKIVRYTPQGTAREQRIHPTQKPVKLYTKLLQMYAKEGYKILDTHVGSASSLIACHKAGLEYWGFEIDEVYYKMARERLDRETAQVGMFDQCMLDL